MIDVKNIVTSLVLSGIMAVSGVVYKSSTTDLMLQQNTDAIKELTQVVTEMRIQNAGRDEKFVTREELKRELKEIRHGS